jgi:hypothetical protein
MKNLNARQRHVLLSMYIDNELSASEQIEVELLLEKSSEARVELQELQFIKQTMAGQKAPPADDNFYAQIHAKLPQPVQVEQPLIQRKFVPAVAGLSAIAFALFVLFVSLQSDFFVKFFSKTTQNVQQAYEENVVNKWIMPLFEKTNKDEALQFAMFGVLPLDDSSNTVLKVDTAFASGYSFELGQGNRARNKQVTVNDLYREIKPTEEQRQALDTILFLASRQIEEGVLLDENRNLAISPSIITMQKSLIARVAACLDIDRRDRMEDFLEARNALYAVRSTKAPAVSRVKLVKQISEPEENNTFVMISRDTIILSEISIDRNRIRKHTNQLASNEPRYRIAYEHFTQQVAKEVKDIKEHTRIVRDNLSNVIVKPAPVFVSHGKSGLRIQVKYSQGSTRSNSFVTAYVQPRRPSNKHVQWVSSNNRRPTQPLQRQVTIELHSDTMIDVRENALHEMERELQRLESHEFHLELREGLLYLKLDSLEQMIRISTDSIKMKLRNFQLNDREVLKKKMPPGVEIRPDYYEYEHRKEEPSPSYLMQQYKMRLNEYNNQGIQLKRYKGIHTKNKTTSSKAEKKQGD